MIDVCKLCLKTKELRNSHIIPKFVFKRIIENGKLSIINKQRAIDLGTNGYKEYLLCNDCEMLLNKYEKYSSEVLAGLEEHSCKISNNGLFKIFDNVDYIKFKLFALSILWRSSIASIDFFKDINMNKKHEENISVLLLSGDSNLELKYPFIVFQIEKDNRQPPDSDDIHLSIIKPFTSKLNGHHCYIFVFAGLAFIIFASSHMENLGSHFNSIKSDNSLHIFNQKLKPDFILQQSLALMKNHKQ